MRVWSLQGDRSDNAVAAASLWPAERRLCAN